MYPQEVGQGDAWGAARAFGGARRAATLSRLGGALGRRFSGGAPCCGSLRCFGEEMAARGLERRPRVPETVEVRKIVGSVGRCLSFDAAFLPVCSCSRERWERVYGAFREGRTLPPVELYKLGGAYFVVDGNHRVSVARWAGVVAVDAVVTEFA